MSNGAMFTLREAAAMLPGAQCRGAGDVAVQRVHTDTRTLQPGDLFVALKGERFDAHDFLAQAKAAGAVAVLCEERGAAHAQALGLGALVVVDSLRALGDLAAAWRQRLRLPLIAVTGSNGKTTVTQMIGAILRAAHGEQALVTQGNLNNEIGVPLTLLRLRATHRCAVVELGMNHPGEIARLAQLAAPTVALVNNAQREHQEFMASVLAVAQENGAVLTALATDGVAVFPADDEHSAVWAAMAAHCGQWRFALNSAAHPAPQLVCEAVQWTGSHWDVQARTPAGPLHVRLHIAGRHNVGNALAAAACALAAGVPLDKVAQGLAAFEPVAGRSRAIALGQGRTLVDDSYNANPDSVRAAIDVLADLPGPRCLVLGDMGEVGTQGPQFHAEVGAYARQRGIDQLLALGPLSVQAASQMGAQAQHFEDMDALLAVVQAQAQRWQSMLVKGSRFMRMERVVAHLLAAAAPTQACPNRIQEDVHAA